MSSGIMMMVLGWEGAKSALRFVGAWFLSRLGAVPAGMPDAIFNVARVRN